MFITTWFQLSLCHWNDDWQRITERSAILKWRHWLIPSVQWKAHHSSLRFVWFPSLFPLFQRARENIDFQTLLLLYYINFFFSFGSSEVSNCSHVSALENWPSRAQQHAECNQQHTKSIWNNPTMNCKKKKKIQMKIKKCVMNQFNAKSWRDFHWMVFEGLKRATLPDEWSLTERNQHHSKSIGCD